jgi:excisionase family DNA binding protein
LTVPNEKNDIRYHYLRGSMGNDEKYISIEEIARRLEVNSSTVYRLVRDGQLPGFKVGGQWRFSEEMLREWVTNKVTMERLKAEDKKVNHEKKDSNGHQEPKH